jgi:predicted O-methyltransferase YrrM
VPRYVPWDMYWHDPAMTAELWDRVDSYLSERLVGHDPALEAVLEASAAGGLPDIQVTPTQGKLLQLLVRITGARRVLEVGTLGGYSTIWMARGLPADGRLVTLEVDPHHAEVARANFRTAGVADIVDLRLGPALETLPLLGSEGAGPFDLVFVDADKPSNPEYFRWAVRLGRPGTVIVVDNVVRQGAVADAGSDDASVRGTRELFDTLAADGRVSATAIQTVGSKGYDGFALALVGG